jgi:hypothetical protein
MQSTDNFRNSTSLFLQEMAALNIQIRDADTPDAIFGAAHINVPIYDGLQSLELPGFNDGSIFAYEANPQDGLNVVQRKFLTKLRFVLINNHPDSTAPRCEEYVRDLAAHLCDCAGLDDGMNLVLLPCNLRLQIGEATFAAIADKECRSGRELACVIQEEKHRGTSTYLRSANSVRHDCGNTAQLQSVPDNLSTKDVGYQDCCRQSILLCHIAQ